MKSLLLLALAPFAAVAADAPKPDAPKAAPAAQKLPAIPAEAIAKKGELLFSDDFEGKGEADKRWVKVVPTFAVAEGVLKGTQTRDKAIPAADGKPAVTPHAAVHGLEVPTKDSIIELKVRFDGATMIDVELDDRKYTGSHYGHLCRAIHSVGVAGNGVNARSAVQGKGKGQAKLGIRPANAIAALGDG